MMLSVYSNSSHRKATQKTTKTLNQELDHLWHRTGWLCYCTSAIALQGEDVLRWCGGLAWHWTGPFTHVLGGQMYTVYTQSYQGLNGEKYQGGSTMFDSVTQLLGTTGASLFPICTIPLVGTNPQCAEVCKFVNLHWISIKTWCNTHLHLVPPHTYMYVHLNFTSIKACNFLRGTEGESDRCHTFEIHI